MLCCEIRLWHKGFGKGTFDPHVFEDEVKFSSFESGDSRWSALLMPQKDLNDKGSQGTSDCAGMWSDGEGELQVSSSTVFLPQEPYLPEGSLRLWCGELMRDGDGRLETLEPGYNKAISGSQYLIECSWCVFWTSCHGFDVSLFLPQAGAHVSTWRVLAIKGFGLSPHLMSRVSGVGLRNQFNWDSLLPISIVSVRPDFGMNSSCPAWTWFGVHTHTHAPREPFWLWASNVLEPASANGLHRDIVRRVSPNIFQHQCRCHQGECIPNVMFDHSLYVHLC